MDRLPPASTARSMTWKGHHSRVPGLPDIEGAVTVSSPTIVHTGKAKNVVSY